MRRGVPKEIKTHEYWIESIPAGAKEPVHGGLQVLKKTRV